MNEQKNIYQNIRLKDREITIIKSAVQKFDKNAEVYIFGSRTDLSKKGGDIDILVISELIDFEQKLKILAEIYKNIGEQKIDLIIAKNKNENSFIKHAINSGIKI